MRSETSVNRDKVMCSKLLFLKEYKVKEMCCEDMIAKEKLEEINKNLEWHKVKLGDKKNDFNDNLQEKLKSNSAGVYFIRTNVPIDTFKNIGPPSIDSKTHKNIPNIINKNQSLSAYGYIIKQDNRESYIIYNGKSKDILSRVIAHLGSPRGTGCLALHQYNKLKKYEWDIAFYLESDERLRTFIEQTWRSYFGWPILNEE